MVDTKTTALGAITPIGTDLLYAVDDPGGTPISAKCTVDDVLAVGDTRTATMTNKTLTNPKVNYTPFSAGTKSTGTYTPATSDGHVQTATNGGAHTLAPQVNAGVIIVTYTNNGSAGAITTSGFTIVRGDAFTTTDTEKFLCTLTFDGTYSVLDVVALQ